MLQAAATWRRVHCFCSSILQPLHRTGWAVPSEQSLKYSRHHLPSVQHARSVPCSQESATGHCPQPNASSPHSPQVLLQVLFQYYPSIYFLVFKKCSSFLGFQCNLQWILRKRVFMSSIWMQKRDKSKAPSKELTYSLIPFLGHSTLQAKASKVTRKKTL